jgi:transmembrane 9 superfamily protein 2/4
MTGTMQRAPMIIFLALAALLAPCAAFYLPGVAPRKYVLGEQLMVKVNTLTSSLTPLQFGEWIVKSTPVAVTAMLIASAHRLLQHPLLRAQGRREGAA